MSRRFSISFLVIQQPISQSNRATSLKGIYIFYTFEGCRQADETMMYAANPDLMFIECYLRLSGSTWDHYLCSGAHCKELSFRYSVEIGGDRLLCLMPHIPVVKPHQRSKRRALAEK